jgi:glucosamine-6-phosphate deaminase
MKIIIADDYKRLSKAAAQLVIKQIKKDKNTVLGLATGSTPLGLYENLVQAVKLKTISFKVVKAFILDEYVGLAKTDRASYHFFMKNQLFDRIDIKKENTFLPNGEAEDLNEECAKYEGLIKKYQEFDLLILGIGLDGHLAFNEPGSDFNSETRVVSLTEQTRRVNAAHFNKLEKVPRQAITIGLSTIMKAKKIILMANGESKAKIINRALTGKITKSVPASILQTHKNLTVILDKSAARELRE